MFKLLSIINLSTVLFSNAISSLIFTSPHLVSYQERIRSNKKEIKYIDYIESIEDFEKKNNIKLGYWNG